MIPLARPVLGEAEERAVLEVLRSGQLSLGPRVPEFEQVFAARVGAAWGSAVSAGRLGCILRSRRRGGGWRRGRYQPVFVCRLGQCRDLRAGEARVRGHRSGHAQPRSGCGGGRGDRAHEGAVAGAYLWLPRGHGRVRADGGAGMGWGSSRMPARRLGPSIPMGAPSGGGGIRLCLGSMRTSS